MGLFSAIAFVLCFVFHFKAMFLTFDLKDSVITVGAMLLGAVPGMIMSVIVALLDFLLIPSSTGTGVYGLLMDIISSVSFVCIGSCIYNSRRTMSGAVIGMLSSVFGMTAVMMIANILITPYYMTNGSVEQVLGLIPTLLLPFNLTKALFNASLVFILYNPISKAMRLAGFSTTRSGEGKAKSLKLTLIVTAVGLVIGAASLLYFFLGLGGSFSID
jgi:riboflavin transporter FmnP